MANLAVLISVSTVDYLGVPVAHSVWVSVPDSVTLVDLSAHVQSYVELFDGVTGAMPTDCSARIMVTLPEVKEAPVAGDEAEKTGLFNFGLTGVAGRYGIDVPAIPETMIVNGKIDLSNAGLQAWIDWLTTAHSGITYISKFLIVLTGLIDALISFRKHRKAESRRSFETAE